MLFLTRTTEWMSRRSRFDEPTVYLSDYYTFFSPCFAFILLLIFFASFFYFVSTIWCFCERTIVVSTQLKNNDGDYGTVNISDYDVIQLLLLFFWFAVVDVAGVMLIQRFSHCSILFDRDLCRNGGDIFCHHRHFFAAYKNSRRLQTKRHFFGWSLECLYLSSIVHIFSMFHRWLLTF